MCSFCEDDETVSTGVLPSARWSWARFAGDVCVLAGEVTTSFGAFFSEALATHFRFVQNRQIDMDDARDFAGDVLAGISTIATTED
jgi:hypothetical protein